MKKILAFLILTAVLFSIPFSTFAEGEEEYQGVYLEDVPPENPEDYEEANAEVVALGRSIRMQR